MIDWATVKFFKPSEFKEPDRVSPALVYNLDQARQMAKGPMVITSSYRPSTGPRDSAHKPDGKGIYHAVDIRCDQSKDRFRILTAAIGAGFVRIGLYTHHIHLDVARTGFDQNVAWWGGASK